MAELENYERIWRYAERSFQKSGQTEFPTVQRVARAVRLTQQEIVDGIDDYPEFLMLTSYNTCPPQKLGEHFVETFPKLQPINDLENKIAKSICKKFEWDEVKEGFKNKTFKASNGAIWEVESSFGAARRVIALLKKEKIKRKEHE